MNIRKNGWVHRLIFQLASELQKKEREYGLYKRALENSYEGIVVSDANGYIIAVSETYAQFVGRTSAEMIGKHVTEVIENTRMHIVAKTRMPEIGDLQEINGHWMIANRIPIFSGDELVAVVGKVAFQDIDELFKMNLKFKEIQKELTSQRSPTRRRQTSKYSFHNIIGESRAIQEAKYLAKKVAKSDSTVLLSGPSGTGKELFAHAIHQESYRYYGSFISLNCSAIPETLFESELFGYKEGAFTGARKTGKQGKLSMANRGTIFLDEISEMPLNMQVKLLRVLQEKEIEPVGATSPEPIDVRVIAATNKNLAQLVREGKFRLDLYYRLNVVVIEIPPLHQRIEDLPLLVSELLNQLRKETSIYVHSVDEKAMQLLKNYHWPGNIRELRNVLERALYTMDGNVITAKDIRLEEADKEAVRGETSLKDALQGFEKQYIVNAIKASGGDKIEAARRLGISKSSLYSKCEKYGIYS